MPNHILIENKIGKFNKKIFVSGDKSISIRWVLFASLASGISKAKNLLAVSYTHLTLPTILRV